MTELKDLFDDLIRVEIALWNAVDARLRAEFDLPMSRFEPMQVIERVPDCRVQDIARELRITVGGASKLVDRIEASGLCERRANPGDRRSSILSLTRAGRRVLADAGASFQRELETRLGATLSPHALEELATTLAALRAAGELTGRPSRTRP